jgi:hypothetical protein
MLLRRNLPAPFPEPFENAMVRARLQQSLALFQCQLLALQKLGLQEFLLLHQARLVEGPGLQVRSGGRA